MNNIKFSAVIVSFNPVWAELKNLVEQLTKKYSIDVFITDNNSTDAESEFSKFPKNEKVHVSILKQNKGIAFAQNYGLKKSIAEPFNVDFVFLFDQDSEIKQDFIDGMIEAYNKLNNDNIAAIGPVFSDSRYGFYYPIIKLDKLGFRTKIDPESSTKPIAASMLIASGMMINVKNLQKIGYMNEALFIDYVDTEWCLRACALGYSFYAIPDVKMKHAIGDKNIKLLKWRIPVHSPFRRYYRIRNSFALLKMPHIPKLMAIREVVFSLIHQTILILCGRKHKEYLKSLLRGVSDGIRLLRTNK